MVDELFQQAAHLIAEAGQRKLRSKLLSLGLRFLQSVRRLLLLQYFLMTTCFALAIGMIGTAWFGLEPWIVRQESWSASAPFLFCLGVSLVSALPLYLSARERSWIEAVDLERQLDEIFGTHEERKGSTASVGAPSAPSREELAQMIGEILDQRLAVAAKRESEADAARARGVS